MRDSSTTASSERLTAEGWPVAISELMLGAAALGLVATVARSRTGAPRMELELGDMDAASPSRARRSHRAYALFTDVNH